MARVDVVVTGQFRDPDTEPSRGVVTFALPQALLDDVDDLTIEPVTIEAPLDGDGRISTVLSTVSGVDAVYRVTVAIVGARARRFPMVVPSSGAPVDITTAQPPIKALVASTPVIRPRITVGPTPPTSPLVNDLWVDTS